MGEMKPWESLGTTQTPDGSWLELRRHDGEYVIRADGYDLMTSRMHGSEDAMMQLALPNPRGNACVLIGGLGMGFTLRATLDRLSPEASVVVGELVPQVVEWNRGPMGDLAGNPLDDPRTTLIVGDICDIIRNNEDRFDAILLDVDNGPDAFTQ
jgi:spermidine synthase